MLYLIFLVTFIISILYFVVRLILKEKEISFDRQNHLKFSGFTSIIIVLILPFLMGVCNVFTAQIFIVNSSGSNKIIELNGDKMTFSSGKSAFIGASSYFNKIKIYDTRTNENEKEYSIGWGTYALSYGKRYSIELEERLYSSLDKSFSNKTDQKLQKIVTHEIFKVDSNPSCCYFSNVGQKFPKYVNPKLKGKRLIQSKISSIVKVN